MLRPSSLQALSSTSATCVFFVHVRNNHRRHVFMTVDHNGSCQEVDMLNNNLHFRSDATIVSDNLNSVEKLTNMMNWLLRRAGPSGFSFSSTAEEVTHGIDASHLTAIVTGASSGIGSETVRVLALRGAHVIMAVRNVASGIAVKGKIIQETGNTKVDVLELDLSSLFSVQKFASNFISLNLPLNILINNAGVMPLIYQLSQDGIELQFATNYLGHFFLTNLLLDIMKETSQNTGIEGRIVNVSSDAHKFCYPSGIQFDRINEKECYSYFFTYCQTKLANVLHANELSRRFKEEGSNLTANSVHPGTIPTDLARHNKVSQYILKILKSVLKDVPQGAATQCFVALHPKMKGVSGKYFYDSNESPPSSSANDVELATRLWTFSENIISSHLSENKIT